MTSEGVIARSCNFVRRAACEPANQTINLANIFEEYLWSAMNCLNHNQFARCAALAITLSTAFSNHCAFAQTAKLVSWSPQSAYASQVMEAVKQALRYPNGAYLSQQTGTVTIGFSIDGSGKVLFPPRIVRSSGHPPLDVAAGQAIYWGARPYPPPPGNVKSSTFQATFQFNWP